MREHQGQYSVIQFVPIPERFEFANVGVALFLPEPWLTVQVKIDPDFYRIKKLFGDEERRKVRWLSDSLQSRLHTEFSGGWTLSSLSKFAALRVGGIQMSPPLPVLVKDDPDTVLRALFEELVGQHNPKQRAQRMASQLKAKLVNAGVIDLVDQHPPEFELPEGVTIKVPFAYQNGSYNMIDPVRLEGTPEEALKNASSRAFEGRWLWSHSNKSRRLIVVGDVSNQPAKFGRSLHEIMTDNNVSFYDLDKLEPLLSDIRDHGASIQKAIPN